MPLSLSPSEMEILTQLAAPLESPQKRSAFLAEIAEALERALVRIA